METCPSNGESSVSKNYVGFAIILARGKPSDKDSKAGNYCCGYQSAMSFSSFRSACLTYLGYIRCCWRTGNTTLLFTHFTVILSRTIAPLLGWLRSTFSSSSWLWAPRDQVMAALPWLAFCTMINPDQLDRRLLCARPCHRLMNHLLHATLENCNL